MRAYAKPPLRRETMRRRMTMKRRLAQESLRILPGLLAERSGGGFAGSPDVPASARDPWIVYSLHAGYRVECEIFGLAGFQRTLETELRSAVPPPYTSQSLYTCRWQNCFQPTKTWYRNLQHHGTARAGIHAIIASHGCGLHQESLADADGAPSRSRTCNPQIRSLVLYPVELWALMVKIAE